MKSEMTAFIICAAGGYLTGCLNPAYILAKIYGFDIREKGSGNAGASNALITIGKKAGILIALFDIFKAFAAVKLAEMLFHKPVFCGILAGSCCIAGHIFPVFMHFRGGKGLASLGGVVLGYNPRIFLIMLVFSAAIALITDYICFVPITAAVAFPVIYLIFSRDVCGTLILICIGIMIEFKHMENILRIREKKEMHFSYLWRGSKELERINAENTDLN